MVRVGYPVTRFARTIHEPLIFVFSRFVSLSCRVLFVSYCPGFVSGFSAQPYPSHQLHCRSTIDIAVSLTSVHLPRSDSRSGHPDPEKVEVPRRAAPPRLPSHLISAEPSLYQIHDLPRISSRRTVALLSTVTVGPSLYQIHGLPRVDPI